MDKKQKNIVLGVVAVVILAIALWLIFGGGGGGEELPPEIQESYEEYEQMDPQLPDENRFPEEYRNRPPGANKGTRGG